MSNYIGIDSTGFGSASAASCILAGVRLPEMATERMAAALPRMPDDEHVGVEMDHVVIRDGSPDLKFTGTLLASAGPDACPDSGRWKELRVYRTQGCNLVLSEVGRSVLDGERDKFKAEVINSADQVPRDEYEARWVKNFFGYTPLAKKLYARLDIAAYDMVK